MKIKNTNAWHDDLRVAALGGRLVRYRETVYVDDETAALLLIQTDVWSPVGKAAVDAAEKAIAAQDAALLAASAAVVMPPDPGPDAEALDPVEPDDDLDADDPDATAAADDTKTQEG